MADEAAAVVVAETDERKPVAIATAQIESSYDLGALFRLLAMYLFGVPGEEFSLSHTMPVPKTATMTAGGNPLPEVWYSSHFPGTPEDVPWMRLDPAALLNQSFCYSPYPEVTIEGKWGWVKPIGAPSVQGWNLTVTMVMDPDTTVLRTITQHRRLLEGVALAGRKSLRYVTPPGPLHNQALNDYLAPDGTN